VRCQRAPGEGRQPASRHSRVGITLDIYTHALPGTDQHVADLVASVILRRDQSVTTAADDG